MGGAHQPGRGGAGRHRGHTRRRFPLRVLVLGIVAVVLVTAGVVAWIESQAPSRQAAVSSAAEIRTMAAQWVAGQVSPSAIVACDPAMCSVLVASGVASGRLLPVGAGTPDPLGSDVVVATLVLRSQFGSLLAGVYAPDVIASFGSGSNQIAIRVIAPSGAAVYDAALVSDRKARITAGTQLLGNSRITVPASARTQLRTGQVDARLLIMLAALAAQQPLRIVAFGDPSPGAATPLRSAEIVPKRTGAVLVFLKAQRQPFLPVSVTVTGAALSFGYAAPSPLGLLGQSLGGKVQFKRFIYLLAAPPLVLFAVACTSSTSSSTTPAPATTQASAPVTTHAPVSGTVISTRSGSAGTYLTDGTGRTVYLSKADSPGASSCTGGCATVWPPVPATGTPTVSGGAVKADLSVITRPDGSKQVAYNGHALYYFASDSGPGQTSGQGVGGFELVSPAGTAISSVPASTGGGNTGGGGY
jgi:predicted lipoprotein with Yx(FWY)xxD motif